jgi:hypothetical protein
MSSIVVAGDTSGSITIAAPAVSGSNTLTLPAVTDTIAGIAATQTLTNKTLTSPTLTSPALGTPASGVLTNCTGVAAAALPAGSVIQVVKATTSSTITSSSTTFVSTGFSATITPRSTASRILVQVCTFNFVSRGGSFSDFGMSFQMYRNATSVFQPSSNAYPGLYISGTTALSNLRQMQSFCFVDSPSSTSALTYTLYWAGYHIDSMSINADLPQTSYIILTEIA